MAEISGRIVMADTTIEFSCGGGVAEYTVELENYGRASVSGVPQDKFLKALAIAVHNDGTPDFNKDYPDAESVMPKDSNYRWIP